MDGGVPGRPNGCELAVGLSGSTIDGNSRRTWLAEDSHPGFGMSIDSVTDARIPQKAIPLFGSLCNEGGTIERFRLGTRFEGIRPDLAQTRRLDRVQQVEPARQMAVIAAARSFSDGRLRIWGRLLWLRVASRDGAAGKRLGRQPANVLPQNES